MKYVAYTTIVRPCLEYASVVWNPYTLSDIVLKQFRKRQLGGFLLNRTHLRTFSWNTLLTYPYFRHLVLATLLIIFMAQHAP